VTPPDTRRPSDPSVADLKSAPKQLGLFQSHGRVRVATDGCGFTDVTGDAARFLATSGADTGLLTLFVRHTSASLTIQENADPDVLADLKDALASLAPSGAHYRHGCEGPDDMPAHIKTMLTCVSLAIPVEDGRMVLGTWQGVYLIEHRSKPHAREIALLFQGAFR